jgi:hypothetical protein
MDADPATPSDEVLDLIGSIAMRRPARNEALRELNELLAHEREALQAHGPGGRHTANIAAVMLELAKVRNSPEPSAARPAYARRNQWGHKGRRTMGRSER